MDSSFQNNCDCGGCRNELNLDRLCVRKIKAHKIIVKDLELEHTLCAKVVSTPEVCTELLMANQADLNNSCITSLNVMNQCVQNITATHIGTSSLVANQVCIPGELKVSNLLNCGKYRATVTNNSTQSYNLGSYISFNTVLDDPNGNITSLNPSVYTAPVTGYYNITLKVNEQNLIPIPPSAILGVPIGNPQLYINGVLASESFSSFLSFFSQNKVILSTMVTLNAGDQLQMKYNVLSIDSSSGIVLLSGTVDLFANGTENNSSLLKIHLLSVTCADMPCAPSVPCQPCTPRQCVPCIPCRPSGSNCDSGSGCS